MASRRPALASSEGSKKAANGRAALFRSKKSTFSPEAQTLKLQTA